jgi:phenylpropionate dioxygenase-like ring-hydroxylating dioxygenase large terminal subunit
MRQAQQLALGRALVEHLQAGSTFVADREVRNPVSAYFDADRWQVERVRLFREHPVVVGLASQFPQPGDFSTFDLPDLPVLVIRGEDGRARCLVNACRHRGALLSSEPCGHARLLVCPFHAWSYRTDGRLAAIPDAAGFTGIEKEQLSLRVLPTVERFGLVWAWPALSCADDAGGAALSVDLDARLERFLGAGLVDELSSYGLEGYHHFRSTAIPVRANWKLMYDTFLEFYHGTYVHKSTLAHLMERNLVHFDRLGEHWRMAAVKRSARKMLEQEPKEWEVLRHAVLSYDVFPNLAVNVHGDHVAVYRVVPGDRPDESVWHFSLLTPEPVVGDKAERYFAKNFDYIVGTGMEDVGAAEGIQRTLRSGANESVIYGRFEPVLAWFHERVAAVLAG